MWRAQRHSQPQFTVRRSLLGELSTPRMGCFLRTLGSAFRRILWKSHPNSLHLQGPLPSGSDMSGPHHTDQGCVPLTAA